MSEFHIARRDGGPAGLMAHRIKKLAERAEQLRNEILEWDNVQGHQDILEGTVGTLKSAADALENAQGELLRIPKEWSPWLRKRSTRPSGFATDALIVFKPNKPADRMRIALGVKENETGRLLAELPGRMLMVRFGEHAAFPAFAHLFREVASEGGQIKTITEINDGKKATRKAALAAAEAAPEQIPAPVPKSEPARKIRRTAVLAAMSRKKLVALAQQNSIRGYSSMTAEQLRSVLANGSA